MSRERRSQTADGGPGTSSVVAVFEGAVLTAQILSQDVPSVAGDLGLLGASDLDQNLGRSQRGPTRDDLRPF